MSGSREKTFAANSWKLFTRRLVFSNRLPPAYERHLDVIPATHPRPDDRSCSAVLEVAEHGKKSEKAKGRKAEDQIGPSRSRSVEGRCYWQPSLTRIAARLSPCD